MLAMVVNDYAESLAPHGALGFIASLLAPTVSGCNSCREIKRGTRLTFTSQPR